jgi:hypothetical protein
MRIDIPLQALAHKHERDTGGNFDLHRPGSVHISGRVE